MSAIAAAASGPMPTASEARRAGRRRYQRRIGFVVGFLLLDLLVLVGATVAFWRISTSVEHALQVEVALNRLIAAVTSAESAQRAYLLTRETEFLAPQAEGAGQAWQLLDEIERLTTDDSRQRTRLAGLRPLVDEKLDELQGTMRLVESHGLARALSVMREGSGVRAMTGIKARIAAMAAAEAELLARRNRSAGLLLATLAGSVAVFVAAASWLIVSGLRRIERDYAEDRRVEALGEHARAADQAKSDFLAAMSHEIRTPMTAVLGMADLLMEADLPARERARVTAIRSSGRHLLSVINDILDFSRIEAGKLTLETTDFSVLEVLEEVCSLMAPQATERGLHLTFNVDEHSPPVVRGDPTRLKQILLNLAGNAIKFTMEGKVEVKVKATLLDPRHARFRFEVTDTGIGMTREQTGRLFQAFEQAEGSTNRRFGGSGLGLAICKRLVDAMGGEIAVDSTPGKGSTFWLEVPFEVGDVVVAVERAAVDPATVRPLRILLADDVVLNQELLGEVLGRHGHFVTIVGDGREAIERAANETFDLVLMDVQMPVMDGVEAARRIRGLPPPHGKVPIVALTANVLLSERQRYLHAGMDRCLGKPVVWQELFATLASIAGSAPAAAIAAADATTRPEAPLLDGAVIDRLRATLPPATLDSLMHHAVDDAAASAAQLASLPQGSEAAAQEVHRLKGTAGSLGLARISEVASALDAAARRGEDLGTLVGRLDHAVAATRAALKAA